VGTISGKIAPPQGSGTEKLACYDGQVYTYDANDRLTAVKVTGGGVAMGSAERDYYAAAGARPSRWAGYGLWAFLGVCGTAMLLPLTLLGGSVQGRRARRRRMVHGVIALLLAVLMIVEGAIPSLLLTHSCRERDGDCVARPGAETACQGLRGGLVRNPRSRFGLARNPRLRGGLAKTTRWRFGLMDRPRRTC